MVPVYRAGRQLFKVRALMALSLVVSAACLWWGLDLAQTYGLNPGDGGVLSPLPQRLAWGCTVASFGIAFTAGMWLYGRLYAARIGFDPDGQQIHLDTVGFFGSSRRTFHLADLGGARSHRGINPGALGDLVGHPIPAVNAPWRSVRIRGWRLPLIIDQQGEVLDENLMRALFGGRGTVPTRPLARKPEGEEPVAEGPRCDNTDG